MQFEFLFYEICKKDPAWLIPRNYILESWEELWAKSTAHQNTQRDKMQKARGKGWLIRPILSRVLVCVRYIFLRLLELRQYKNGLASVQSMFDLKLPPFFHHLHGKEQRAAISKLACISQKQICSYIVLALAGKRSERFMNCLMDGIIQ